MPFTERARVPDKEGFLDLYSQQLCVFFVCIASLILHLTNRLHMKNDFIFLKQLDIDWQKEFIIDVKSTSADDCSEFDTYDLKFSPIFEYEWPGIAESCDCFKSDSINIFDTATPAGYTKLIEFSE